MPRPWIITEQTGAQDREYAQVLVEGRDADDVRDAGDENRPFKVTGDFSDQDLVGIVRFLRAARIGSGPIARVSRETVSPRPPGADAVRVDIMMRRVPNCYDIVTLWRTGSGWQQAPTAGGACP